MASLISHHLQQFSMATLRYLPVLVLALLVATAYSQQDAAANVQADPPTSETPSPTPAADPNPAPQPTVTETPPPPSAAPATPPPKNQTADYMQRIQKIREEVAKSTSLDHKYLESKIQEVIGSMSAEQKENFEQQLSADARMAYQKYKKMQEERVNQARQEEEKLIAEEPQQSQSEIKLKAELEDLKSVVEGYKLKEFNNYQFELYRHKQEKSESFDFRFTLPIAQQVAIYAKVFANTDGVYGHVKDIENEEPLRLYVYENNQKIVQQKSFYSVTALSFEGKANTTYLLRFTNGGNKRLVSLSMGHILLEAHIDNKLTVEDVADHQNRVRIVRNQMLTKLQDQRDKLLLQNENEKSLLKGFNHYYFYNIGEIVVLGIICVIQVESIRKLLLSSSVV